MNKQQTKAMPGSYYKIVKESMSAPVGARALDWEHHREILFDMAFNRVDAEYILSSIQERRTGGFQSYDFVKKQKNFKNGVIMKGEFISQGEVCLQQVDHYITPVFSEDNLFVGKRPIFDLKRTEPPDDGLVKVVRLNWYQAYDDYTDFTTLHLDRNDGLEYVRLYWGEDRLKYTPLPRLSKFEDIFVARNVYRRLVQEKEEGTPGKMLANGSSQGEWIGP